MKEISNRQWIIAAILVLLPVSLFLYLNHLELRFEEPRRAVVSLEMIYGGDYIVPRINGWLYYNKTPLFNWLVAAMFNLFGRYDNWLVRVPSLLAFLLTGYLNFRFVRRYGGKKLAVLSSLFFLTSADIFFYETLVSGEIDLFYALLVYIQAISIFHFYHEKKYASLYIISYAFMALGFLTKGFPSFLFQGFTLLMMAFWKKDRRFLFRWEHGAGLLTAALLIGGYFFAYSREANVMDFIASLFSESVDKSALGENKQKLLVNTISFPLLFLSFVLPWSLFVIYFFKKRMLKATREQPFLVFCFLFILVNVPVYWITGSVKNRYMLMFFPFLCILFAFAWINRENAFAKPGRLFSKLCGGLIAAVGIGALIFPFLNIPDLVAPPIYVPILFALAFLLIAFLYFRLKQERIYLAILFLVVLRMVFAFYYFPSFNKQEMDGFRKSEMAERMVAIANGKPIFLSGSPDSKQATLGLGPVRIHEASLSIPPFVSYGIPFYFEKLTGKIMEYRPVVEPGNFYLCRADEISDDRFQGHPVRIRYRFRYEKNREELCLFFVRE